MDMFFLSNKDTETWEEQNGYVSVLNMITVHQKAFTQSEKVVIPVTGFLARCQATLPSMARCRLYQ